VVAVELYRNYSRLRAENMKSIQQQLAEITKQSEVKASQVVRASVLEVANRTVLRTPVDNGLLRANWLAGINSADESTTQSPDKGGAAATGKISAKIGGYKVGDTLYVTNSLPYAERIEYQDWSEQAPAGMMRISVAEFDVIAEQMIKAFA
jgi:hypothetical protein